MNKFGNDDSIYNMLAMVAMVVKDLLDERLSASNDIRVNDPNPRGMDDLLFMCSILACHAFCGTPALWTGDSKFATFHAKNQFLFPGKMLFTTQFKVTMHFWDNYYKRMDTTIESSSRIGTVVHLSWAYAVGTSLWIEKQLKRNYTVKLVVYCYELTVEELTHGMWCKIELPTILDYLDHRGINRSSLIIKMVLLNANIMPELVKCFVWDKFPGVGCEVYC